MITRRALLKTAGASAAIGGVALAGLAGHTYYPGPASARAPWTMAGESFGDPRLDALAYAILAPNPHNRQPWRFELIGHDRVDVYCDLDRRLPETDPFDRQLTIGFGCMLGLLEMAAAERGHVVQSKPFPDGESELQLDARRIAQLVFRPGPEARDPLFSAVLERRTNRQVFDAKRAVPAETLAALIAAADASDTVALGVGGSIAPADTAELRDLSWKGWLIEWENAATRRETLRLLRIGNRAITQNPDGIAISGIGLGMLNKLGLLTVRGMDQPGSVDFRMSVDMWRDIAHSAQGFVWISSPDNRRATQLEVGRAWVRMNLAAQGHGLGFQPMSQILQEYDQMAGPYAAIHQRLQVARPGVVQMLGRIGYASVTEPAPRWPLRSTLIAG